MLILNEGKASFKIYLQMVKETATEKQYKEY